MYCPSCGNAQHHDATFCHACGTRLGAPADAEVPGQPAEPARQTRLRSRRGKQVTAVIAAVAAVAGAGFLVEAHAERSSQRAAEHRYLARIHKTGMLTTTGVDGKRLLALGKSYCASVTGGTSVADAMDALTAKFPDTSSDSPAGVDPNTGDITDMGAFSADLAQGVTSSVAPLIVSATASTELCPSTKHAYFAWVKTSN